MPALAHVTACGGDELMMQQFRQPTVGELAVTLLDENRCLEIC